MSFWGLVVESNKLYSQTVPMPYRVTMAALGADSANSGKTAPTRTSIVLVVDNKDEYVICNLTPGKNDQQNLDLVLQAGAEIAFKVTGERPATVYLTGYYMEEQPSEEDEDHEMCDDEECDSEMEGFVDDEAIEDDEDEDEDEEDEAEFTDELSEDDFSDDDDDEEFDSEEEEEEESRIKKLKSESEEEKKSVQQKKRPAKEEETTAIAAKKNKTVEKPAQPTPEDSKSQSPKSPKKQQQQEKPAPPTPNTNNGQQLVKKTLPNGLQIEDLALGIGPKAKKGRKVGITYTGTLANGKVFDESKGNDILRFTLGKGEVVKGMDLGVEGMAQGGIRRLTIPASLGYGNKAIGKIPANSTLIFEVQIVQVNTQQ